MTAINFSADEIRTGKMTPEHQQTAVRAVREDGYVLLNELIDPEIMAVLRDKMLEDVDAILARKDVPFNFNVGNLQQDPPPIMPYLYREVLVNDIVISITRELLGAGLKSSFYSGNTALPHSTNRQPAHADIGQLWPDLEVPTPPFALVVNVLPVDVSAENGSTEIWPGTHKDTSVFVQKGDIKVSAEKLEEQRRIAPPFQYSAKAGSVVVRDMRLWHAGMPNHTATPRPMIAMIHTVSWWGGEAPLTFPKGTESLFEHPDLHTVARFVDGPIDYLNRNEAYDLMK
jgi:hypothetical protein